MRKFLALIMVIAMVASFACVLSAEDGETVIAHYTFDNGMDEGLEQVGENATFADGTVTFGADTYFKAPIDLTGAESVTIVMKVKPTGSTAWPYEITSEESHAWPHEHYLGALLNDKLTVERYGNTDAADRPGNVVVEAIGTDMIEVKVVYNNAGGTTVYVNGEEKGTFAQPDGFDLSIANCVGENPTLYLGHANWGENSEGMVLDEITISAVKGAGEGGSGEKQPAPPTGFATVALAVAALGSGAYIVSKKNH